jgi:hypothetical protein
MPVMRWLAAAGLATVGAWPAHAQAPAWDMVYATQPDVEALIARGVDYVGLDGFDTPAEMVAALQGAGIHVWCYLSAGTIESWRPDYATYQTVDTAWFSSGAGRLIGKHYDGWPGERWLDIRAVAALVPLMDARLAMCAEKGFDMVDFDNLDGYGATTGFPLTEQDALVYAQALAEIANRAGLAPIFNNVPDLADELEPWYAGFLMEDCVLYGFCASAAAFVAADKPVFNAEYPESWQSEGREFDPEAVCATGADAGVAMLLKTLDLSMDVTPCP